MGENKKVINKNTLKNALLITLSFFLVSCGNALTDWILPIKGKKLDPITKVVPPVKPKLLLLM